MSNRRDDGWEQVTARYQPRRATMWRGAIFFSIAALVIGVPPLRALRGTGTLPDVHAMWMLALAGMSVMMAAAGVAAAIVGLPRLSVSDRGVRLDTLFGSRWAAWHSLGAFELDNGTWGMRRRRLQTARARLTGPDVSRNLRRKSGFIIPNSFRILLPDLVATLNAAHPTMAAGGTMPVLAPEPEFGLAGFRQPWLTYAMLLGLVGVFVAEQMFAVTPAGPLQRASVLTLRALGGLNRTAVLEQGEWYRLVTAPLLHADLGHLLGNGFALLLAGFTLERLIGRAWYFALFVLGGIGGSLASLAVNPPILVSVGASGAIMAMFAALIIGSFRLPEGPVRTRALMRSVRVLIPSMLPAAANAGALQIDYGAHIGGAVAGGLIGAMLLGCWPRDSRLPGLRNVALGVSLGGVMLFVVGAGEVAGHYPAYQVASTLIPPGEVPRTEAEMEARGAALADRYPRDPRSHMYWGLALVRAHDDPGAEREYLAAVTQAERTREVFGERLVNVARAMLAAVVADEGDTPRAREIARGVCHVPEPDRPPQQVMKVLVDAHLCG
jgi:rhomboid protease GluP